MQCRYFLYLKDAEDQTKSVPSFITSALYLGLQSKPILFLPIKTPFLNYAKDWEIMNTLQRRVCSVYFLQQYK